jgi:uncharacterized protein (DUF488 family)
MNQDIYRNAKKYLYTIGYEKLEQELFLQKLFNNNIELLIDIRKNPISRKRGFSKKQLSSLLNSIGIDYIHFPELGSPKEARDNLRSNGDFHKFYELFMEYLDQHPEAYEAIELIINLLEYKKCCILCYESKPEMCHRRILVSEIKKREDGKLEVVHL